MRWNNHSRLKDCHAFLSPSQHGWLRYDDEKLTKTFYNKQAAAIGSERHAFAAKAIELGIKLYLDERNPDTLAMYVNDAIDEGMTPEVILYVNDFAFGTADAIFYDPDKKILKIFDLKTGTVSVVKVDEDDNYILEQVEIYCAYFCMEYHVDPYELQIDLRIYQNQEKFEEIPDPERIELIMGLIQHNSDILYRLKGERRP